MNKEEWQGCFVFLVGLLLMFPLIGFIEWIFEERPWCDSTCERLERIQKESQRRYIERMERNYGFD